MPGLRSWFINVSAVPAFAAHYELSWPLCYDPKIGMVATPSATPDYSTFLLPPTLTEPFGVAAPKCGFPSIN